MASLEELKQILKEDQNGQNLYEHLTQTLMQILIDRPKNAYEKFELISSQVKSNPLNPQPNTGKPLPLSPEQLEMQLSWTNKCSALLKVPDEPAEDSAVKLPDLLDDANLYEWAGVTMGKGDLYRLFLSIKKFAETLPGDVERLRWVGRISTLSLPYYILEGLNPEDEEGVEDTKQEGRNGANRFVFYVTQNIESNTWTKLPNVTMEQVVKVRQFKRLLRGDLNAPVSSYPPFPGTEKNLLRAILACIVGETSISPDGFYDLDDNEDPPVVKAAEAEAMNERFPKTANDLKEAENWKHHETSLNKIGRVLAMPEQLDESGEPIAQEEVELSPPLDNIKPEEWTIRTCPGGAGFTSTAVVVVRSLRWPGAVAVASGRKYTNVYIGNGLAYSASAYSPPLPQPICVEWPHVAAKAEDAGEGINMAEGKILLEQADVKVDPTPPVAEGEGEED